MLERFGLAARALSQPTAVRGQGRRLLFVFAASWGLLQLLTMTGMLNDYWLLVLDQSMIIAIAALGLSLIYGFCGQFSLGHAAFYGLGAYTAGLISKLYGHGSPTWFVFALVCGALVAAAVAFVVGLPVLRLRSDYLGIATLGFGIIVKVLLDNSNALIPATGGATGMTGTPQLANMHWILAALALAFLATRNIAYSTYGRVFVAVREDELAADAVGINTTKYKMMAFVLGCALAGLAGGLYAHRYPFLHPSSFDFLRSLDFLLVVVLGGLGSLSGTLATAMSWVFLSEVLRMVLGQTFIDLRGVIYALILVVVVILRPQGLLSGREWGLLAPEGYRQAGPPISTPTPVAESVDDATDGQRLTAGSKT